MRREEDEFTFFTRPGAYLLRIEAPGYVIVTYNLKHFPITALSGYGVEAQHPDEFVSNLIGFDAETVYAAAKAQRARLKNPPKSAEDFLVTLEKQSLAQTVAHLRKALELI